MERPVLTALVSAMGSQALVTKIGTKRPLVVGLATVAVGIFTMKAQRAISSGESEPRSRPST